MSALLQLDFSGPQTRCDYPGCLLDSFHEGEHQVAPAKTSFPLPSQYDHVCSECGRRFAVLIDEMRGQFKTCGSQECLLSWAREHSPEFLPVSCTCSQRPYPHELSVHKAVKFESRANRWPWSLRYAPEMEVGQ